MPVPAIFLLVIFLNFSNYEYEIFWQNKLFFGLQTFLKFE
jgi:hypothetical protein